MDHTYAKAGKGTDKKRTQTTRIVKGVEVKKK